ncbi:MAG: hypothetical protein AAFP97_09660 [Pseudomonadota bacterium]
MSVSWIIAFEIGAIAFAVSLAVTGFSRLGGLGDIPDHRSSHKHITPTAGGIGIMAGIGAALAVATLFHANIFFERPGSVERLATFLSLVFAMSFLGLVDDRFVLASKIKFPIMLLLSAFACSVIGPVMTLPFGPGFIELPLWVGLAGSILWVFTVINTVNFSDGINGMFATTLGIASAGLCALALLVDAPITALLSGVLTASLMGFLPYNFRRTAAIFSGDCGSLGASFIYAGAVLFLIYEQPNMNLVYAGPLLILPILADILITLVRKPGLGIGFLAPHNKHMFQRWARYWRRHRPVTLIYGLATAGMVFWVLRSFQKGSLGATSDVALFSVLFIGLYVALSRWLPD